MLNKRGKDGFILQAGILAIAGIICRIIGALYRSPLTSIIGDEGNGYYSSAYNIYTIILLISSYSIPSATSKVIAQRLALKEYRNAHKVFLCALLYVTVIGSFASIIAFWKAGWFVGENSILVLRIFAPGIFLSGLLGVLRGYFQAHHTMVQTSISQIIEQILNAVVSIIAAYYLVNTISYTDKTSKAIYGAAGSAIGTGAGILFAFIFMCMIYLLNSKIILKRIRYDNTEHNESYGQIIKVILLTVTPIILCTFIYNFSTTLNQIIFIRILKQIKGLMESDTSTMYGIFAGKAVVIANIPIAVASAMSMSMIPTISGTYIKGNINQTNDKISYAIRSIMIFSIPSMIGLTVLSKPIVLLLFPQKSSLIEASNLLRGLSITIVFYSLSTLSNAVLQSIGKVKLTVVNATIALLFQTLLLVPLLLFTDLNLYGLVLAAIAYSFIMCILNGICVKKYLGYQQEVWKTFIKPTIAAIFMGIVASIVYQVMYYLIKSNVIVLITSIILASTLYFGIIIRLGVVNEDELTKIPKGYVLVKVARKLKLL